MSEKKKELRFSSKTIAAGSNAKTVKGDDEWLTAIMYLAPYKTLEGQNTCSMAALAECWKPCLFSSGRGAFSNVRNARLSKTARFFKDKAAFVRELSADITRFENYCTKNDVKPCIRLNGTSDIRWELLKVDGKHIFDTHPNVQFYDYTKIANRRTSKITNYHLTWSYSAANPKYEEMWKVARKRGMNIAVVFRDKHNIPSSFLNLPTLDGDADDLRFLDAKDHVVSLYAKGDAKKDYSGFVVDNIEIKKTTQVNG
jgi:hypothetical protein